MKLRRKLRKKTKISSTELPKEIVLQNYKPQRCAFIRENGKRCMRRAVGSSTLCNKHGGGVTLMDVISAPILPLKNLKYNPSYHPIKYIAYAKEGLSDVEIAAELEVSVGTLRKWAEKYPEFTVAYDVGMAMHEAWFLRKAKRNLNNTSFQTALFKFIAGNKLGYADKVDTRNMNVNNNNNFGVLLVPGQMTAEEWEKNNIENETEGAEDAEYTEISR